jgi:outer membrane protein assembly factor BamB
VIDRRRAKPLPTVRVLLVAAAMAVTVVAPTGSSPSAAAAGVDAWPSAFGGPANTTNNPGESVLTAANASRVQQAWVAKQEMGSETAPTVVNGVVYYFDNPTSNAALSTRLVAASARTGARLWSLLLPAGQAYMGGMTVAGDVAVMGYQGHRKRAGITAVNLTTHRVAWNRALPALPAEYSWLANWLPGQVVADSTRVYIAGGSTDLAAFRLSDGAPLWSLPMKVPFESANIAVANGVVYGTPTSGGKVTAYNAATGRRLWTAPGGRSIPVVAGGRVFTTSFSEVIAVNAAGCGRSTCPALWTRAIPDVLQWSLEIGGADAQTLFAVYTAGSTGRMVRLSAASGAVQWSAAIGEGVTGVPARGADVVWVLSYVHTWTAAGDLYRLQAFPATGSSTRALRTLNLPAGLGNSDMDIAVASRTVFVQAWPQTLTAYRIPGT